MCNANNHPPNCQCGWGGVSYGGSADSSSWLFNKGPRLRKLGRQTGTSSPLSGGYTVPNQRCPVCGAQVYFYESPYGGRVFFDSLGPPWPKHPCTSNENGLKKPSTSAPSWHTESWRELSNVTINQSADVKDIYIISGLSQGKSIQLQFKARQIVMAEIVRFKKKEGGGFLISILDFDEPKNEWAVWEGVAFANATQVHVDSDFLSRRTIDDHHHMVQEKYQATNPHVTSQLMCCPACKAVLLSKNYLQHLRDEHGLYRTKTMGNFR